jgi:hypothetical protein
MAGASARIFGWRALRPPDSAGAIYGTLAAMAVIAGAAREHSHGRVLALAAGTVFVFWLAHVYARALAHHLRGAREVGWPVVTAAMAEQRPMLEAPAVLFLLLALGGIGLLDHHLAVRLALWTGVTQLVAWGIAYARRQGWGWLTSVTVGVVNGAFGLVIVVLEVLIH